jgi:hypothetical protein
LFLRLLHALCKSRKPRKRDGAICSAGKNGGVFSITAKEVLNDGVVNRGVASHHAALVPAAFKHSQGLIGVFHCQRDHWTSTFVSLMAC